MAQAWVWVAGCTQAPCPRAALEPLSQTPSFAIVTSDYSSTAIGLLNAKGELITEAWIDSGTIEAGVTATLSGDVVLPTQALAADLLTLIDRRGVDVVSALSLTGSEVEYQLSTQLPPEQSTSAFRANPQDVIQWNQTQLLVSRHEPNLDPDTPELDSGNDLVLIDTLGDGIVERFDLRDFDQSTDNTHVYARPSRLLGVGQHVVVGLSRLSADFRTAGTGAILSFDRLSKQFRLHELPGLANCGNVYGSQGDSQAFWLLCTGPTFVASDERREQAAIVRLALQEDGSFVEQYRWRASEHTEQPVPIAGLVEIDERNVVVVGEAERDALMLIDTQTDDVQILARSSSNFTMGAGVYAAAENLLLVPDTVMGLLRFTVHDGEVEPIDNVNCSPCRRLPARQLMAF